MSESRRLTALSAMKALTQWAVSELPGIPFMFKTNRAAFLTEISRCYITKREGETMREPIVINAETREITVPEAERAFGVAGERKVEVKHIRIEGRTVDGTDLTQGFTWKVSCENAGKELCADLIDVIVSDAGNIEFDWIVGAAPMAYKGTMHFAVCAVRVDAAGNILQEWHSKLGAGDVANGIEATVQNIGGQDLLAHIQSITAAAQQNAAAAQRETPPQPPRAPRMRQPARETLLQVRKRHRPSLTGCHLTTVRR